MDIKKPQLVKVGAFAYFFEGVLQHPRFNFGAVRGRKAPARYIVSLSPDSSNIPACRDVPPARFPTGMGFLWTRRALKHAGGMSLHAG